MSLWNGKRKNRNLPTHTVLDSVVADVNDHPSMRGTTARNQREPINISFDNTAPWIYIGGFGLILGWLLWRNS